MELPYPTRVYVSKKNGTSSALVVMQEPAALLDPGEVTCAFSGMDHFPYLIPRLLDHHCFDLPMEGGKVAKEGFSTVSGPLGVVDPHCPLSLLATRGVLVVEESYTLGETIELMKTAGVSVVLVGNRAGIATERDLVRAFGAGYALTDPVESIMTRHPITVDGSETILSAAAMMLNEQVRHLLVERGNGEVAVVSIRELLAALLQAVNPQVWLASLRVSINTPPEVWIG